MTTPQTKRGNPEMVRTSAGPSSHDKLSSSVTALAIEQVLAELGVHTRLSDIVRGAQLIEPQSCSHVRAANWSICDE